MLIERIERPAEGRGPYRGRVTDERYFEGRHGDWERRILRSSSFRCGDRPLVAHRLTRITPPAVRPPDSSLLRGTRGGIRRECRSRYIKPAQAPLLAIAPRHEGTGSPNRRKSITIARLSL